MNDAAPAPAKLHLFVGAGCGAAVCALLALRPADEPWAVVCNEPGLLDSDALMKSGVAWRELLVGCACCTAASSPVLRAALAQLLKARPKPLRLLLVLSADAEPMRLVPMLAQYFGKAAPLESIVLCTSLDAHATAGLVVGGLGGEAKSSGNSSSIITGGEALGPNLKYRSQYESADVVVGLPSKAALCTTPGLAKASVMLALLSAADLDASRWNDVVGPMFPGHGVTTTTMAAAAAAEQWIACGPPDALNIGDSWGWWRRRLVVRRAEASGGRAATTVLAVAWVIPEVQAFAPAAMETAARAVAAAVRARGAGLELVVGDGGRSRPEISAVRVACVLRSARGGFCFVAAAGGSPEEVDTGSEIVGSKTDRRGAATRTTPPRPYEHRWPWSRVEVEVDYGESGVSPTSGEGDTSDLWSGAATAAVERALCDALAGKSGGEENTIGS
jgi:hypothetical protein